MPWLKFWGTQISPTKGSYKIKSLYLAQILQLFNLSPLTCLGRVIEINEVFDLVNVSKSKKLVR